MKATRLDSTERQDEMANGEIDVKRKLTSRKLWAATAGFVAGLVIAFGGSQDVAVSISGVIMSGASVIGFIFGEGLVDYASAGSDTTQTIDQSIKSAAVTSDDAETVKQAIAPVVTETDPKVGGTE